MHQRVQDQTAGFEKDEITFWLKTLYVNIWKIWQEQIGDQK